MAIETPKNAQDLRNIYQRLQSDIVRFEAYLDERLYQLVSAHPDAVITILKGTEIKAKNITKNQIGLFTIEQKFEFIEKIEAYILSKNKYVQGKLF